MSSKPIFASKHTTEGGEKKNSEEEKKRIRGEKRKQLSEIKEKIREEEGEVCTFPIWGFSKRVYLHLCSIYFSEEIIEGLELIGSLCVCVVTMATVINTI